jgi:hypothetical protein
MKRSTLRLALLFCAKTQINSLFGAWDEMRHGMSRADAAGAVGQPAVASVGRGFEAWTFDHGGEVMLFRGSVLYWSVPKSGAELAPQRKPSAETADQAVPLPGTKLDLPPILHSAINCLRTDCPIHSPAKATPRK